jgi:ribosomal protein S6
MSKRYELLYIISAALTETEVGGAETKVSGLLAKYGATIDLSKRLGKLKLTYPIKDERFGYYVAAMFTSETDAIAKIEEALRISPEVLRHLITQTDKTIEQQKFDLIQFLEINVEEERARRRERAEASRERGDAPKEAEGEKKEAAPEAAVVADEKAGMSTEELQKKIDTALTGDVKGI